jgi:hypothetical protein
LRHHLTPKPLKVLKTRLCTVWVIALPTHAGGDVLAVAEELSAAVAKGAATQEAAEVAF